MRRWTALFLAAILICAALPGQTEGAQIHEKLERQIGAYGANEFTRAALAEYGDDELGRLAKAVFTELRARKKLADEESVKTGDRGEAVIRIKTRLYDLGYLSENDGDIYDALTAWAVSEFQRAAETEVSGVADVETQYRLFRDDAPAQAEYAELDYAAAARWPEQFKGQKLRFEGVVLQLIEREEEAGTRVNLRIATEGHFGRVMYVLYLRPEGEARVLEGDYVAVYGVANGLHRYENVMGAQVTLPELEAARMDLIEGDEEN